MKMEELFKIALGLQDPWFIERVELKTEGSNRELHLYVGHEKRSKFIYDGTAYSVYDHQERTWRHLNFFEHECYLHARVPRVKTDNNQVLLVEVPWALPGSSFTLLFEAYAALLIQGGMSFEGAGNYMTISGKSIWTILNRMVSTALATQDLESVGHLGIDETSSKKGHEYLTVLTDVKEKKVVGIAQGKNQHALSEALIDMEVRGANKEDVELITMDMSRSYIAGATAQMPQAKIVFDRYHIEQNMNQVVDKIRREESKDYKDLKKTKYLWLKNYNNLSLEQQDQVEQLAASFPTIGIAYRLKEQLKEVLNNAYKTTSLKGIKNWMDLAWDSGIESIQSFVKMMADHWYGIKTYFEYCISNGYAERVNLKIQEIKRTAKGYRNPNNFMLMIYFHLGKLELGLPTKNG